MPRANAWNCWFLPLFTCAAARLLVLPASVLHLLALKQQRAAYILAYNTICLPCALFNHLSLSLFLAAFSGLLLNGHMRTGFSRCMRFCASRVAHSLPAEGLTRARTRRIAAFLLRAPLISFTTYIGHICRRTVPICCARAARCRAWFLVRYAAGSSTAPAPQRIQTLARAAAARTSSPACGVCARARSSPLLLARARARAHMARAPGAHATAAGARIALFACAAHARRVSLCVPSLSFCAPSLSFFTSFARCFLRACLLILVSCAVRLPRMTRDNGTQHGARAAAARLFGSSRDACLSSPQMPFYAAVPARAFNAARLVRCASLLL